MKDNFENNNKNNEQSKFELPEGYFQKSASTIFNKIEWQEEHKEFTNLLNHKNKSGFILPENYFSKGESKLELIEFEKLNALTKNNSFKVPVNYFDEDILKSVTLSEVEVASELNEYKILASLKKQNNFKVPENYFVENEKTLNGKLNTKQAKVINLFNAKMWYSVAALLVIVLGLWVYNTYYKMSEVNDCGTLACIDKIDLVKAKHLENIETEELYKLVNTKKLEENLASASASTATTQNADTTSNTSSTNDLLDEL